LCARAFAYSLLSAMEVAWAAPAGYRLHSTAESMHAGVIAILDKWVQDRDGFVSRGDVQSVLQLVVPQKEQVDDVLSLLQFDENDEVAKLP